MTKIVTLIIAILFPSMAAAHPQHAAGDDAGLLHLVTDPFHVALTAGAVLTFFGARRWVLQRLAPNRLDR